MRGSWLRQNEQVQVRTGFCSGGFESRRATGVFPQWHPPAWFMIVSFVSIVGCPQRVGQLEDRSARGSEIVTPATAGQAMNFSPPVILSMVLRSPWRPSPTRSSPAAEVAATLALLVVLNSG